MYAQWSAIVICWGWGAGLCIILLPIYESKSALFAVCGYDPATMQKKVATAPMEPKKEVATAYTAPAP